MLYKRRRERKREKIKKSQKLLKKNIGTKLITNTKKLKLKIQSLEFQKYDVKEKKKKKKKKGQKIIKKYIYMKFALKKGYLFFFCKVIVGYKSEN